MPTTRNRIARPRRADAVLVLTSDQRAELVLGPRGQDPDGNEISAFDDDEARADAWAIHGEAILARHPHAWAGRRYDGRPSPWWYSPGVRDSAKDYDEGEDE